MWRRFWTAQANNTIGFFRDVGPYILAKQTIALFVSSAITVIVCQHVRFGSSWLVIQTGLLMLGMVLTMKRRSSAEMAFATVPSQKLPPTQ